MAFSAVGENKYYTFSTLLSNVAVGAEAAEATVIVGIAAAIRAMDFGKAAVAVSSSTLPTGAGGLGWKCSFHFSTR